MVYHYNYSIQSNIFLLDCCNVPVFETQYLFFFLISVFGNLSVPAVHLSSQRGSKVGFFSILRMEVLGGERGRCCCGRNRLEVHITTGAGLFGPGRAAAPRGVPVHASTLATCHFPTVGREGGRGLGRDEKRKGQRGGKEELEKEKKEGTNARKDRWIRKKEKKGAGETKNVTE